MAGGRDILTSVDWGGMHGLLVLLCMDNKLQLRIVSDGGEGDRSVLAEAVLSCLWCKGGGGLLCIYVFVSLCFASFFGVPAPCPLQV